MSNVQSVITPVVATPITAVKPNGKDIAIAKVSTATTKAPKFNVAATKAIETAFTYGQTMAGLDGTLVKALQGFKTDSDHDKAVRAEMLKALNVGFIMRKLGVIKSEAERINGLRKYNKDLLDDDHRTMEQERVVGSCRTMWSRATDLAGVIKIKSDKQIHAELNRETQAQERKDLEARREEAWEIVHPKQEEDVNVAMARMLSMIQGYYNSNAAKFKGNTGSAWRNWIAKAPKTVTE